MSQSPASSYLHVGPDLSLASCMVWDETLASQGRGAGVAPVERMEPNYRPVCHLLWEKVEGGGLEGGREGGGGRGERPATRRTESRDPAQLSLGGGWDGEKDCWLWGPPPMQGPAKMGTTLHPGGWDGEGVGLCPLGSSLTLRDLLPLRLRLQGAGNHSHWNWFH